MVREADDSIVCSYCLMYTLLDQKYVDNYDKNGYRQKTTVLIELPTFAMFGICKYHAGFSTEQHSTQNVLL